MNVPRVIQMMREELASVEQDDADAKLESTDEFEDELAEAWRNGYARALQVLIEENDPCRHH
jgi:hypothetical protein